MVLRTRLALAPCVLAAEALVLTSVFDALPLAAAFPALRYAGWVVGFGAVFLTTLAAIAISRRRSGGSRHTGPLSPPSRPGTALAWLVHAAAFALLFPAIALLLEAPSATTLAVSALLFALLVLAAAAATLRPESWRRFLRAERCALAGAFALACLGLGAGLLAMRLWDGLADVTLALVVPGLALFSSGEIVVHAETRLVGLDGFVVEIAPVCAGMEGLGLILVLSVAWLIVRREHLSFPRALLLVPLGLLAVFLANVGRIVALILVGARIDPGVALGGFHSKAGWLFFCAVALGLATLAHRTSFFARAPAKERGLVYPAAPYLAPLLALLGTGMLTGLFAAGLDGLYALRIVAAAAALFAFRRSLPLRLQAPAPAAVALGLITFVAWFVLHPQPAPEAVGALVAEWHALSPVEAALWTSFRILGSVLVVPVVEELAFRSFLLRRLADADFQSVPLTCRRALPVLGSSLAFGLTHQSVVAGTVAGLLFAYAQAARGRTEDAIVAHVVANAAVAAAVLLAGQWWLWA